MAEANRFWGPQAFTDSERVVMEHCYSRGFGWQDALNELCAYRGIQRKVFEVRGFKNG